MHLTPEQLLNSEAIAALPDGPVGVAVSGGGDSVALLHLMHAIGGRRLRVATVDHRLRPESSEEAALVAALAAGLGVDHDILIWQQPGGAGNLQANARAARRSLLSAWAAEHGLAGVALGHTADDQAETFLMRLARGSGLDGLAAMEDKSDAAGVRWVRPLLTSRRADLRAYLRAQGVSWAEDPSNDDPGFERVRVRKALGTLNDLGIEVGGIAQTTRRLRSAKQVLYAATKDLSASVVRCSRFGALEVDISGLLAAKVALRLRLMSEALRFVSGAYYAPRAYMVEDAIAALGPGFRDRTLHGCVLRRQDETLHIRREPGATGAAVAPGAVWDDRWMVTGPAGEARVSALGQAGLEARPSWRGAGAPREVLLTTPAVWRGDDLIAAPLLDQGGPWQAEICLRNDFFAPGSILH